MTVEHFREEMRELDVWPSNSMLVVAEDEPLAVMIATKREREVLVQRLGVRSDQRRRGYGGELLTSLSQKLAVLGPDRLVTEIPERLPEVVSFFQAQDYRREATYTDYCQAAEGSYPAVPEGLVIPITVDDLLSAGLLQIRDDVAWERSKETLIGRRETLKGSAVATPDAIEAYILYRQSEDATEIFAAGGREGGDREMMLEILLRDLAARTEGPLTLPKLAEDEVPETLLQSLGFEAGERHHRYAATARPL